MSEIISSKNGRLHIYVRQDKYKGKLRSENWVGRTYHNGKQKVLSSGTTNLEEAKVILEKWYDSVTSGQIQEKSQPKQNIITNENVEQSSDVENQLSKKEASQGEYQNEQETRNKKEENFITQQASAAPEKKKKLNLDLSLIKKMFAKKTNDNKKKGSLLKFKNLLNEKISKSNISNEEIAGIDISENSIKVAQLSKSTDDKWILEKISLRLLESTKVANGILSSKDYIAEELKLAMSNAKITTSNVAISIPVTSAIIRVVTSPLMTDDELQKAIETDSLWENLVQLTDDLNDYSVFHQIISRNPKANTMEILFVASKLSDVNSYSSIVKKAGLNPVIMDVKCFTLKNAFDNSFKIENKSNNALLEIGTADNYLIIVHDNTPIITDIFLRTNEKDALANFKNNATSDENDATNVIRRYSLQLKQALSDYEGKYGIKINNIKVVSNLNNIEDLIPAFRKNLLNTGLQVFDPLSEVSIPEYNKEKTSLRNTSIYTSVLGLAYRKLDVFGYYKFVTAVKNINLLPNREALKRQSKMKFLSGFAIKGLAGGIAALYLFLMGFSILQINLNKGKLENFSKIEAEFNKINSQNIKLTKQVNDMNKALKLGTLVNSNQVISYRALAQITRSVPQRVQFTTLNFDGKSEVIISGLAFSDQDIINFIKNLNNKDLVEQASLRGMNVPKGQGDLQSANNKKGFSILCKLKI